MGLLSYLNCCCCFDSNIHQHQQNNNNFRQCTFRFKVILTTVSICLILFGASAFVLLFKWNNCITTNRPLDSDFSNNNNDNNSLPTSTTISNLINQIIKSIHNKNLLVKGIRHELPTNNDNNKQDINTNQQPESPNKLDLNNNIKGRIFHISPSPCSSSSTSSPRSIKTQQDHQDPHQQSIICKCKHKYKHLHIAY